MGCGASSSHNAIAHKPSAGDTNQNEEASNDAVIRNFIQYSNRVHNINSTTNKANSSSYGKSLVVNHDEHTEIHNLLPQTHEIAKSDTAFSFEESSLEPSSLEIAHKTTESALTNEEKMIVAKLQAGYLRKDLSAVSAVLSVFEDDKGLTVTAANGTSQNKTLKICRWLDRVLTEKRTHEDKFFNPELPEVWPKHLQEITDNMTVHSNSRKQSESYHVQESGGNNDGHPDQYNRACKTNARSGDNRKVHSDSSDEGHDNVVSHTSDSGSQSSNDNNNNNNNNQNHDIKDIDNDKDSSDEIVFMGEDNNRDNKKFKFNRSNNNKNIIGNDYNEEDDDEGDDDDDDDEVVRYKIDQHHEQSNKARAISHATNKEILVKIVNDCGIGVGERNEINNKCNYDYGGHENPTTDVNFTNTNEQEANTFHKK